jgi:hypothetical protein
MVLTKLGHATNLSHVDRQYSSVVGICSIIVSSSNRSAKRKKNEVIEYKYIYIYKVVKY